MMPGTLYGFGRVTKALGEMGEALNTFSTEKLSIFSELIDKLKGLKEVGDVKVSLSAAAEGISDIAEAIDAVPILKSIALTNVIDRMTVLTSTVTPAAIETTKQVADVVKDVASVDVGFTNVLLLNAIGELIGVMSRATADRPAAAAAAGAGGDTTVVLEVDGRQLGKTVVDLVNRRYNMRLAT